MTDYQRGDRVEARLDRVEGEQDLGWMSGVVVNPHRPSRSGRRISVRLDTPLTFAGHTFTTLGFGPWQLRRESLRERLNDA